MNCIDCKYFKVIDYADNNDHIGIRKSLRDKGYGHCTSEKVDYGMTSGMNDSMYDKDSKLVDKEDSNDKLLFEDNEGYAADLIVGPNFGCKHFESKP